MTETLFLVKQSNNFGTAAWGVGMALLTELTHANVEFTGYVGDEVKNNED